MKFDPRTPLPRLTRRGAMASMAAAGAVALAPMGARAEPIALGERFEGAEDAPVTVYEYVSFTCPHCAHFHKTVYPELKKTYVDTGKVKLVLREVYFDRLGLMGGLLARCEGGARYWGFVDMMLRTQADWTRSEDLLAAFKKMGRLGGLTDEQVQACVTDQDAARSLIEQYDGYRKDPRLTGTPTLIVGDEKIENPTFERLSAAIDALL